MIEPNNWLKKGLVMFIANHTPKCHAVTRLVSESMERPLPLGTRIALRIHFLICVWCERYRDQIERMRNTLLSEPEDAGSDALSADARTRLKAALGKRPE